MLIETFVAPPDITTLGWRAGLALQFTRRDAATLLTQRHHYGPLRVQKALYPEGEAICHAILLHPPAGIAGGDELEIGVVVEPQAHALLTTPGAGKWYRSAGPRAWQALSFDVGAGAVLEWLPQETIFFSGCHAMMNNRITLAEGARYLGWDVWCMGRAASGERFEHGELRVITDIRIAGKPIWMEQGSLSGGSGLLDSAAGLAGRSVCGTLLAAGNSITPELLAACRALKPQEEDALCGITVLPQLLVARYLGNSSEAARAWFVELWRLLRPALLGHEAQAPRIWNT
jgi:urease accessory protein